MNPSLEDRVVTSGELVERRGGKERSEPWRDRRATSHAKKNADGILTVEGEVDSVAAKKLALERLAALPEVIGIVDRLHV
jgi:hypothetical protein